MKITPLLVACLALSLSNVAHAAQAAADRVSGTWTGHMGRSDNEQVPITVVFKYEGQSIVGTITGPPHPGDIRNGTFDAATGALKFEVVVQNDEKTIVPFEGKVVGSTASGTFTLGGNKGAFRMTRSSSSTAPPDVATAAVRRGFALVSGNILKSAEMVPPDKYSYRPTPSVRTFGELIGHIVDGYAYFCGAAAGRKAEWSEVNEKGSTDKATLARKLKEATDACAATHAGSAEITPLVENLGHTNLHYGNVITYLRMMGLTPPSS
jgi:DinB superfamily